MKGQKSRAGRKMVPIIRELIKRYPDTINIIGEPLDDWQAMVDESKGNQNILELFYSDIPEYAFSFQMNALKTRIEKNNREKDDKRINIVERSIISDHYIFAKKLKDEGRMNQIEWQVYGAWYKWLSGAFDVDPGWGTDNYGHLLFDNMNNHSVVVRVDAGNASILVTGDLEKIAIAGLLKRYRATRWLDVDVLQVGHHGSVNGTTREMLAVTTPQVALIAAGSPSRQHSWTAWAYGHPRAEVVDLLQENVSNRRGRIEVNAGKSAKRFVQRMVDRAIYSTAWEGSVDVDLGIDGSIVTHVAR